jgi:DNA-binding response OmpR family regulator
MTEANSQQPVQADNQTTKKAILHLCRREILRPLRDQILRLSGYDVDSTCVPDDALKLFHQRPYDLVIIDVEGEFAIHDAERVCAEIKTIHHGQNVAFVCNWRVAILTDCPDEILRTEFDPAAFVQGVRDALDPSKK